MKKVVFTSLIFASYLFGTSIENIVQKSLQNNFDIKSAKIGLNRTTMQELDRTQKRSLTGQ